MSQRPILPTLLLLQLLLLVPSTRAFLCVQWHTVVPDDSCYVIWTSAGLSEDEFFRLNNRGNLDCANLQVDDEICLAATDVASCAQNVQVRPGDTCYSLKQRYGLSEQRFRALNEQLNCDELQVGDSICLLLGPPIVDNSTWPHEEEDNDVDSACEEIHVVASGDLCWSVKYAYSLSDEVFEKLNPGLDCDRLQIGQSLCVSSVGCGLRHSVVEGDTCARLADVYRSSLEEMRRANANLDCDRLQIGQRLCVWEAARGASFNATCKQQKTIEEEGFSCWRVALAASLTVDEFRLLNPWLACDAAAVPMGSVVCVRAADSQLCAVFRDVGADDESCEAVAAAEGIPVDLLQQWNPVVNCEGGNLRDYSQVCVGRGPFSPERCFHSTRVGDQQPKSCEDLSTTLMLSIPDLLRLNPSLDCAAALPPYSFVCLSALEEGQSTIQTMEDLFEQLRVVSPSLHDTFAAYRASPSEQANDRVYTEVVRQIVREEVYSTVRSLVESSSSFAALLDVSVHIDRAEMCNLMQNSTNHRVRDCYCDDSHMLLYCYALTANEMLDEQEEEKSRSATRRTLPCTLSYPLKDEDGKLMSVIGACFGGGCSIAAGFIDISIDLNFCVPPIIITQDIIEACSGGKCQTGSTRDAAFLGLLADQTVGGTIEICFLGKILKHLKVFGLAPCASVNADYAFFVGMTNVGVAVTLPVLKVSGGVQIKSHDVLYPKMCDMDELKCNDYCLWNFYNTPNGKTYGYLEARLFHISGILKGIKIADFKFGEPRLAGCKPDKEIAILWVDERSCASDSVVWVRCMSGNDKMDFVPVPRGRPNGLTFKKGIKTLFFIEFVDENGEKIGFDVYGGKSKIKVKKGNFYYAVRNDGIYKGTDDDDINELVQKWARPCTDKGSPGLDEPTGTSQVPAAACGKRVVGYYTGWGDREISLGQLRKLTHVIFAFIATKEDGSIGFGAVSEEDNSPEAAAKAERRFRDLKSKAREANAGVRVLFAVGGWANSQFFSAIAADAAKRSRFVQGVADFLKKEGIDGVDLDWEYPVTGGAQEGVAADKGNFVTLLRELRERLDSLAKELNRRTAYVVTLASAAGEWTIRPGYDLHGIMQYADFVNVMTYDYYGAWASKWGAYTGPPAPLYYGSPKGFSGKLNADFSMKYYTCHSNRPSKLNMGVPFYGRYWENVGNAIEEGDDMWRVADGTGGGFQGGYVAWRDIGRSGWSLGAARMHKKARAPFIWDAGARRFLGFENEDSLRQKVDYAVKHNLGGVMAWSLEQDDDSDTLLSILSSADLCSAGTGDSVNYDCVPIDDVRWWTPENSDEATQGQCGKYAPLINGFYPVCDPDDPGYACCSPAGYCGSGADFCDCAGCVDYRSSPSRILDEPTRPTRPVTWHTEEGKRGRCGKGVEPVNGQLATCNPDSAKPCCSNGFYCGSGADFCDCAGCVDYSKQ